MSTDKVPFNTERDAIETARQPLCVNITLTPLDIANIVDGMFLAVPINGTDIAIIVNYEVSNDTD